MKLTVAQHLLKVHLAELGVVTVAEFRFCMERRYRFDLYAECLRMGFEVNGTFGGLHGPRWGASDLEKLNLAQLMGYRVMQFTNRQVEKGEAKEFLKKHLSLVDASPRGQRHSRRAKAGRWKVSSLT